jgi:DNA-binding response OmpR family regulator
MTRVLVVADSAWARNDVHSALTSPDFELVDLDDPTAAAKTAAADDIDVVVTDLQVASMGGMAVARAVRETASVAGTSGTPVILLLDRSADSFLAGRSGAAGWVTKPFTARQLRTVVTEALASNPEPEPVE